MDFVENLARMRKRWQKSLRFMSYLPRPYWIFKHPLFQTYKDAKILRKYGQVYYAALVQANEKMFYPIQADSIPGNPGAILYSMCPPYDTDPEAMLCVADELYDYKGTNEAPEEWKELVAQITDEHSFTFQQPVPVLSEQGGELIYTPLMFFRQHLPGERLIGSIFPILAAPDRCQSVMVLPKWYWTKEMKEFYRSFS